MTAHEVTHAAPIKAGSATNFGYTFAGLFTLISILPVVFKHEAPHALPLAIGAVFMLITLWRPSLLEPLNQLWFRFSLLLGKIMVPVVMSAIWLIAVVPTGLIMRTLGKDSMGLKPNRAASTYWVTRTPDADASMSDQF